ncbi:archaemetzincin-1-like [Acipenser ruthenus]|uniref:archaemetzincin-1-like n=1 Tax=Acipenser ruthenus TaxID=7906 RepID=UPI002740F4DC|nr:archaemetzincin-1-like [Acipenser ruthenus]
MLHHRHGEEFYLGPRALKEALVSTNPCLKELYDSTFCTAEKHFLSEAYNPNRMLFQTLQIRTAFDWLVSRPEAPEDFETFYSSTCRRPCSSYRKTVYLQPIDLIDAGEGAPLVLFLDTLKSYAEAFFCGLEVKLLPSIPSSTINCHFRHNPDSQTLQLHTDGILKHLRKVKPADAFCVLGLTFLDLYPCDTWNYTFGKTMAEQAVGVCSFARFVGTHSEKYCQRHEQSNEAQDNGNKSHLEVFTVTNVLQCCKVLSHEVGHLVGMGNCRWLRCAMQGGTSQDQVFLRPMDLCPVCLRKLQYALGFTLIERYKKLQTWARSISSTWGVEDSIGRAASEDNILFSTDSGVSCENHSEPISDTPEPTRPDTGSQELSIGQELQLDGPPSTAGSSSSSNPRPQESEGVLAETHLSTDLIKEYVAWLGVCVAALERETSEDEVSQLDSFVDALPAYSSFTERAPAVKCVYEAPKDERRLKKLIGAKLSSLRRRLSTRNLLKTNSYSLDESAED